MTSVLFKVTRTEQFPFGSAWCGPSQFEHGEPVIVAKYARQGNDGFEVEVECLAAPARFYIIRALPKEDSSGFELRTGSGMTALVAEMAKHVSERSLTAEVGGRP